MGKGHKVVKVATSSFSNAHFSSLKAPFHQFQFFSLSFDLHGAIAHHLPADDEPRSSKLADEVTQQLRESIEVPFSNDIAEPIQEEKGKEEQKEEEIEKEEEKEVDEEQEVSAAWDAVSFLEEYFEEDVYFQIWENDAISLADEWDQRHCVRKTKVTREDFGRMKKKWKTEKPSKKFIKAPRYHKRLENAMIQEELLLREKENSAAKRGTTYQPYVPPIITARSTTTPATATTTPRNTHNAHRATTNNRTIAEEDAEIQRALQASIAEMSTSSLGEALSTQQIQLLSALQARDLTPEDYEILLLLDSSVKPKTLIPDQVKSFPQLTVDTEDMCSERCAVCMMEYEKEERLTKLPNCGHLFHSDCIGHWLCNSSVNCPIDGLPVTNT